MRGTPKIAILLNYTLRNPQSQWISNRKLSSWTRACHNTSGSRSRFAFDKPNAVCCSFPFNRQSLNQQQLCDVSQLDTISDVGQRQRQNGETLSGEEDKRRNNAYVSASAVAAGLLLILWLKSQWFKVEAAKPIYNNENEQYSQKDEDKGDKNRGKKSNRERFNFISEVVDKVKDTVVSIEIKDHSYVDFFTGAPHTASNGSGFIISDDGLILTNAHVIAQVLSSRQRSSFSVRLSDGRTFAGSVENVDVESDLATIRIHAKNLPALPLGNSSDTKIGEWVVAVGAPLSLTNTITAGVISSTSRGASELGIRNDINYIQTDAAITYGNSGGPLINLDGEAIGINSMKVTSGISFAIPINHAIEYLKRLEARKTSGLKKPSRRYMGITILTVTEQIKRELESRGYQKVSKGVLVWQVVVGSPAYLAGLTPGDIIVRINGTEIASSADLYEIAKSSDKLHIHVQRADKVYACTLIPEHVTDDDDEMSV